MPAKGLKAKRTMGLAEMGKGWSPHTLQIPTMHWHPQRKNISFPIWKLKIQSSLEAKPLFWGWSRRWGLRGGCIRLKTWALPPVAEQMGSPSPPPQLPMFYFRQDEGRRKTHFPSQMLRWVHLNHLYLYLLLSWLVKYFLPFALVIRGWNRWRKAHLK